MKHVSKIIVKQIEGVSIKWFAQSQTPCLKSRANSTGCLRQKREGEAWQIMLGIGDDNGWEEWRSLAMHFEPGSAVRRGQPLSSFGKLSQNSCRSPEETNGPTTNGTNKTQCQTKQRPAKTRYQKEMDQQNPGQTNPD